MWGVGGSSKIQVERGGYMGHNFSNSVSVEKTLKKGREEKKRGEILF